MINPKHPLTNKTIYLWESISSTFYSKKQVEPYKTAKDLLNSYVLKQAQRLGSPKIQKRKKAYDFLVVVARNKELTIRMIKKIIKIRINGKIVGEWEEMEL